VAELHPASAKTLSPKMPNPKTLSRKLLSRKLLDPKILGAMTTAYLFMNPPRPPF
jgi:hypothetical protein